MDKDKIIINKGNIMRIDRFTPQMNVTEIAKRTEESGEEPGWGTIMSKIPKVVKLTCNFVQILRDTIDRGQRWEGTMATNSYSMLNPMTTVPLVHQKRASRLR